jgi:hypothetical protein
MKGVDGILFVDLKGGQSFPRNPEAVLQSFLLNRTARRTGSALPCRLTIPLSLAQLEDRSGGSKRKGGTHSCCGSSICSRSRRHCGRDRQ